MDTSDTVFEAEVQLDGEATALEQERRKDERAQVASKAAKGGVTARYDELNERVPLLPGRRTSGDGDGEEEDRRPSWAGSTEFDHLPWHKRPSIFWVLGPFFIMACAFGGIIAPKMNLIQDLVCREYIAERNMEPGYTWLAPVDFNNIEGGNDQCAIPEVSARTSMFNLWGSLIAGMLSAFTAPKLGTLSDRYGRKPILVITSLGTICGEVVTIFAATYPERFPVPLLLLSYAFDGLTGSFIVAMSIANAYATDCTPPSMRNVAFGYFHASLFTGIAIGPIIAGYIVKWTGRIVTVFWVLGAVHVAFMLFVGFVVPESLSDKRRALAQDKHDAMQAEKDPNRDWINTLRSLNVLEPLHILRPKGPGSSKALRRNLLVLAAVDTIVFGVAMGSMAVVIIYMRQQFGWQTFESGKFMTIVNSTRVVCLLFILPTLTRLVRGTPDPRKTKSTGADMFDLTIIRVAIFIDCLGYLGYTLSRQGSAFILSGMVASFGGIGSPTLQSALTKHVPADRTGQLLGAIGLLHALARVVAPAVFSAIFAATVGKFNQAVFVCLCATFGLAFVVSWFIKPHVYYDEDKAERGDEEAEEASAEPYRIPIVSSMTDAAANVIGNVKGSSTAAAGSS
ncbi:Putative sugar transporter, major facilitator superfamily, MFS transporter superfamily [Septoria linicola]|uniref:Sugar transporter, major facilitator superfamily, MFS transporter superfamily n=1 Tax=Septoria linicola TaxID=215465 RepID=A0A9Q9AU22_9PEZI|nr:Putative sugar transporter, major facilitator superfamily, MFS transporter superfamily [Septoria linicola]